MTDIGVEIEEAEGWVAIAAPQVVLLLRGAGEDPRVASLQAAADGGSLDDVLQILTAGGIQETPDFVGIESGLPVRVVARGEGYAVLSRGEGDPPVRVRATGRAPWTDEDAPADLRHVSLRVTPAWAVAPPALGVATRRVFGESADPESAVAAPAESAEATPPLSAPMNGQLRGEPGLAPQPSSAEVTLSLGPDWVPLANGTIVEGPAPADSLPGVVVGTERPPTDEEAGRASEPTAEVVESDTTSVMPSAPAGAGAESAAAEPEPAEPARPAEHQPAESEAAELANSSAAEAVPPEQVEPDESEAAEPAALEHAKPPQPEPAEAVQPEPVEYAEPEPAEAVKPKPVEAVQPAAAEPAAAATVEREHVQPAAAEEAAASLSAELPAQAAASPSSRPPSDRPASLQAALAARSAEQASREAPPPEHTAAPPGVPPPQTPELTRPQVSAVICVVGHASPPDSQTCRVCQREIPAQRPVSVPRPILGVLRLSTGGMIPLDRGVLLGRSPRVKGDLPPGSRPHVLQLPSPGNDISRNHAEVILDGWNVLVRDVGSTNGTTVGSPGRQPVRLRPGEPRILQPGDVFTMADEITVTYELRH